MPKMAYPLHLTSLDKTQCGKVDTKIRQAIFPPMRLNRNIPDAIAYGPEEYGGMEFTDTQTLQDQVQIPYVIKQIRWGQTVANDMLVTLDNLQLMSGFVRPVMEFTETPLEFCDKGFFSQLRARMGEYDAHLWIEQAWTPKLQREGDESIMERFVNCPGITKAMLRKANNVRLYLRVITITDLTTPAGDAIANGMLTGSWQSGSDLEWPHQECPPKKHWAAFRKCLRMTFCQLVRRNQPAYFSMILNEPLGKWYPVRRYAWWPTYKANDSVIYREDDGRLQVFKHQGSGFHIHDGELDELPLPAIPSHARSSARGIGHIVQ